MIRFLVDINATDSDYPRFGKSVKIFKNYIVIGSTANKAYIFKKYEFTEEWIGISILTPNDRENAKKFGAAVDITNKYIIIGDYLNDIIHFDAGRCHIFTKITNSNNETNDIWNETEVLYPDTLADYFGESLSISSDNKYIIVGCPGSDEAYIFEYNNVTNTFGNNRTVINALGNSEEFGFSVYISDINQNYAVVGAERYGNDGAVYIFTKDFNSGEWNQISILQPNINGTKTTSIFRFGYSVACFTNYNNNNNYNASFIAVGAIGYDSSNGMVFIYERDFINDTKWNLYDYITEFNSVEDGSGNYFGWSVAIYNGTVIVGATGDDQIGSAFIYKITPPPPTMIPTQIPTNTPTTPTIIPTNIPSFIPTVYPTFYPTNPTNNPTIYPTIIPTINPLNIPTNNPTIPTNIPSYNPTNNPTFIPSIYPTFYPTKPTFHPTKMPTQIPLITASYVCLYCLIIILIMMFDKYHL